MNTTNRGAKLGVAHRLRRVASALSAALAIGAVIAVGALANPLTAAPAEAKVTGSDFNAGLIISNEVMYNEDTMTVAQIQAFLNAKGGTCKSGYTCLATYDVDSVTKAADPMCAKYSGAKQEKVATIIYKVAQACGVNPQVLLVTLQKEQSLVTATAPTSAIYRKAMGFGCPDTANCDSEFYGFFNQVYKAAWAYQRYTTPKGTEQGSDWCDANNCTNYNTYPVGKTVPVKYHPSSSWSTSSVPSTGSSTPSTPSDTTAAPTPPATSTPTPYLETSIPTPAPTATSSATTETGVAVEDAPSDDNSAVDSVESAKTPSPNDTYAQVSGPVSVAATDSGNSTTAATCKSKLVKIENRATQALYTYTPYTPNAAALKDMYGTTGDSCSSWGNRNFFRMFTDWFGSTIIPASNQSYVAATYADVLGRTASESEVYNQSLTVGKTSRTSLATSFLASTEYRTKFVKSVYLNVLGRAGESTGVTNWVAKLNKGTAKQDDLPATFMATDEFYRHAGSTNKGFVTQLYSQILHHAPNATALANWTAKVATQGRTKVALSIWMSTESSKIRTADAYQKFLGRAARDSEQLAWATKITKTGFYKSLAGIIASDEYLNRAVLRFPYVEGA